MSENMTNSDNAEASAGKTSKGNSNWVWIVLAIVVVLAGGYYFMSRNKAESVENGSMAANAPTSSFNEGSGSEENAETANGTQETPMVSETATPASESVTAEVQNGVQIASVEGGMYYFKPNKITVKKGKPVKITLTSAGGMHDFVIDELKVKSDIVNSNDSTTVEFTPTKSGEFQFYCNIANHKAMGMVGTLVVE